MPSECETGHEPQEWLMRRGVGIDQDGQIVHGPVIGREIRCARCGDVLEEVSGDAG